MNRLIKKVIWIIFVPFGGLTFLALSIVRIFLPVRIGVLNYGRVGHLAGNTELWMRYRYLHKKGSKEILLLLSGEPANQQIMRMLKRKHHVLVNKTIRTFFDHVQGLFPKSSAWIIFHNFSHLSYAYESWNNATPQLSFLNEEIEHGKESVSAMGVSPDQTYVCFFARDKAYLDNVKNYRTREDWSYHDYRDCNIGNYIPSVQYLTKKGIWAFRMGAVVEKPMHTNDPRIIDYASKHRSDFLDAYLMANCKFFIGDTAGIYYLTAIFNIPSALANMIPMGFSTKNAHDLYILKKLWCTSSKRLLSFKEIIERGADRWNNNRNYESAGIEPIENTPEEIFDLVLEMNARIDGNWKPNDEDEDLQRRFWDLFPNDRPVKKCQSRIGAIFLRQNKKLLY